MKTDLKQYIEQLNTDKKAIVLLEGTRKLPEEEVPNLIAFAKKLAEDYPNLIFRTGNAGGSDEAFAKGIAMVDVSRLEYVLPNPNMGKKRLQKDARLLSLQELPQNELDFLMNKTLEATPNYKYLVECFRKGVKNRSAESAKLLIRDVLKIYGSAQNQYLPADIAIFYVNNENPKGGGTGHTIRACEQNNIPVFRQTEWL